MISRKKVLKIKRKISKQFPEFKGIEPQILEKKIKPQTVVYRKLSLGAPKEFRRVFRLKFSRVIKTTDEIELERILLVTLDERGEIIKITQSR